MSTLDNLESVDVREFTEDKVAIDLKDSGIDLQDLRNERDVQFEVDPRSMEEEDPQTAYFDNEDLFKQLNFDCLNDGDADDDLTPFQRIAKDLTDITENKDGGVLKGITKHGAGQVVPPRSLVRVHYNAYKEFDDEPFDSTYIRNRQTQFKLGDGEVLAGWEVGVQTMKRGETARFMLSPEYGYGKLGCPPRIPANATVLFEIELISFVDQEAADNFDNFSEEERKQLSFTDLLKVVEALRLTGNDVFKINQVGRAAGKYSQAVRLLENARLQNEAQEVKMKEISLKLYLNLSICELKQNKHGRACKYARKALDIQSNNVKALYRLARALRNLGEYSEARRRILYASQLDPADKNIKEELSTLNAEIERHRKNETGMAKRMFQMDIKEKPVEKVKPKAAAANSMVEMMKKILKSYKSDDEQKQEITLPGNLTSSEISCVKDIAQELGLYMFEKVDGGVKSYRVSKQ